MSNDKAQMGSSPATGRGFPERKYGLNCAPSCLPVGRDPACSALAVRGTRRPNQIQISKEVLNDLMSHTGFFDIRNLAFGIAFVEVMVCPLGQLIETILQEDSFLLEMGPVSILIDLNRFSPDEYPS